jgi:hypothetical protein
LIAGVVFVAAVSLMLWKRRDSKLHV